MMRILLFATIVMIGSSYWVTLPFGQAPFAQTPGKRAPFEQTPGEHERAEVLGAVVPNSESITLVQATASSRMPISITPYYNSDPLQVNVGQHSEELTSATAESIGELVAQLKQEWASLPVETLYVLAIRLYDLGLKDEAVYWFYTAQFRARLLSALLPEGTPARLGDEAFERLQAHRSFHQLAGTYINGYAFGQLDQLEKTLKQVQSEGEQLPPFKTIYPRLEWIDEDQWAEKRKAVSTGLDKLLEYIVENADEIKAIRKQRGMEGKY